MNGLAARAAAVLVMMASAAEARILVHGHRGARALRPENTLPAFEYAISVGVDVLELDLAVTKDNVVVVSHDPILPSNICKGPKERPAIREMTLAELRQYDCGSLKNPAYPRQVPTPGTRVPTLDEVFALAPRGSFEFNIETKMTEGRPELAPEPAEFARLVLEVIRRYKLEKRVMVQSFDWRTLHAMKKLAPDIRRSALYERGEKDFVSIGREADAGIVSPQYLLVSPEKVKAAHAAQLQVVPWTPNTPAEWDRMIQAGVDAIISDDPAALIDYLKKRQPGGQ
jgi:glycerophosphoryl diester phosphodiesterase